MRVFNTFHIARCCVVAVYCVSAHVELKVVGYSFSSLSLSLALCSKEKKKSFSVQRYISFLSKMFNALMTANTTPVDCVLHPRELNARARSVGRSVVVDVF